MTTVRPAQLEELRLFIHGKSVDARSGRTFESQNPYTGTAWARLAMMCWPSRQLGCSRPEVTSRVRLGARRAKTVDEI
jgi:acyl-CoA reductase-like NAD-dependent aldehyde dehydrogenase